MSSRPSTRKMKPAIRAIVEWATVNGWSLEDEKDGSGHWVLKYPKEKGVVRLPDTPGDYRGLANAKAEIRRKSGLPNESGPAAKYRHEGRRDGFSMEATLKERRLRAAREEAERLRRQRLYEQLTWWQSTLRMINPRREPERSREIAAKIVELEQQLNRAHPLDDHEQL